MLIIKYKRYMSVLLFFVMILTSIFIIENSGKYMYPLKYKEYVFRHSAEYRLDPYLVFAIIKAESNFNPNAKSKKNAMGLMQLTEKTASWGARSIKLENFSQENLYDPDTNISLGCWYLGWLMNEFKGDTDLVITAYNGGNGRVNEWLKSKEYSNSGNTLDRIPYKETDTYVKRVKNYYLSYKKLYEEGF